MTYDEQTAEAASWFDAGVTSQDAWRARMTLEAWFGWRPASAAVQAAMDELSSLNLWIARVENERCPPEPYEEWNEND